MLRVGDVKFVRIAVSHGGGGGEKEFGSRAVTKQDITKIILCA